MNLLAEASGYGFAGLLFGAVIFFVAACWVLFPILMFSKANEILKVLREIRDQRGPVQPEVRPLPIAKAVAPAGRAVAPSIYHYDAGNGESVGPLSIDVLRNLEAQGRINDETQIYSEKLARWLPLSAINQ